MKRDMDLVRWILRAIENQKHPPDFKAAFRLWNNEHEKVEIGYHVLLLKEAGLVDAIDVSGNMEIENWEPTRLTWAGHEFLEASRDDTRWEEAKAVMKDKGGGMVFEIFKQILLGSVRSAVFGP